MIQDDALANLIGEYGRELQNTWGILPGGMFNPLECISLYALIRHEKPDKILEIGSLLGRSTCVIQQALEYNGKGNLITCDLPGKSEITKKNVDKMFPRNSVTFLTGEVETTIDAIPNNLDVAFIDGPHNSSFMQWCIDFILPKVRDRGIVLIHDINLSFNWNYRDTPGCETECLVKLRSEGKLPLTKFVWLEDWCLNHHLKVLRDNLYEDFPMIGRWGILNPPESASLSIWIKK